MIEEDVIDVSYNDENSILAVDVGFDEQENVKIDHSKINLNDLLMDKAQATEFYGILPKKKPLYIPKQIYFIYNRKIQKALPVQTYAPCFNDYYVKMFNINEEDIPDNIIKIPKIGYNIHTKQIVYSESNGFIPIDTTLSIRDSPSTSYYTDNILNPSEASTVLPMSVSKPYMYKMFNNEIHGDPKIFNAVNRFIHRTAVPIIYSKQLFATKSMMYSEIINHNEQTKLRELGLEAVTIPYGNKRIKLTEYTDFPKFSNKHDQTLSRCHITEKLPMKVIHELTRGTPNTHFINEYCVYDSKDGVYLLQLEKFLSTQDYDSLKPEEKIFPVLCRHEYLQFVDPDFQQLSKECFVKGKCRYCNQEIFSETVDNKFDIDPNCYFALQYYAKILARFYIDPTDFQNGFNALVSQLFVNNSRTDSLLKYDNTRIYSYIFTTAMKYVRKNDGFSVSGKSVTKLDEYIKEIVDKARVDVTQSELTEKPYNKKLLDAFVARFCNIKFTKHGPLHSLELQVKKDALRMSKKELLNYHPLLFLLERKLWSRKIQRQLHETIEQKSVEARFDKLETHFLTENEISSMIFNARGICPVKSYHCFKSDGVCKHCGYFKGMTYKKNKKESEEYANKWTKNYNSLTVPEMMREDLLIKHDFEFNTVDDLKKAAQESTIKNFKDYLSKTLKVSFEIEEHEKTVEDYMQQLSNPQVIRQMKTMIINNALSVPAKDIQSLSTEDTMSIVLYFVSIGKIGFSSVRRLLQKRIKNKTQELISFTISTLL